MDNKKQESAERQRLSSNSGVNEKRVFNPSPDGATMAWRLIWTKGKCLSEPRERPEFLRGYTQKVPNTPVGNVYVTVNFHENKIFEVMATVGKNGSEDHVNLSCLCKMISKSLRRGIPVLEIVKDLNGSDSGWSCFWHETKVASLQDLLAKVMLEALKVHHEAARQSEQHRSCVEPVQRTDGGDRAADRPEHVHTPDARRDAAHLLTERVGVSAPVKPA